MCKLNYDANLARNQQHDFEPNVLVTPENFLTIQYQGGIPKSCEC